MSDDALDDLIVDCREVNKLFRARQQPESSSCFEIWRRALQQRDERAWAAVLDLYADYVYHRLGYHLGKAEGLESEDYLISGVFQRIQRSITPEKFTRFANLPALMGYLNTCCHSEAADDQRHFARTSKNIPLQGYNEDNPVEEDRQDWNKDGPSADVQQIASQRADRERFWQAVKRSLPNEADRVVIWARFVEELPPREIPAAYPHLFKDVEEVNRIYRNAMWRLRHNPDLENWFREMQGEV